MKYEKIELWLETLPAEVKETALATWYDHVEKFNVDNNYQQHSAEFMQLWASFQNANK